MTIISTKPDGSMTINLDPSEAFQLANYLAEHMPPLPPASAHTRAAIETLADLREALAQAHVRTFRDVRGRDWVEAWPHSGSYRLNRGNPGSATLSIGQANALYGPLSVR